MRRILTTIVALMAIFVITGSANAQTQGGYKYNVSIDPIDLLVSDVLNANFEFKLSNSNSFLVSASYYRYSDILTGFGIGGTYRWYFDLVKDGKKALEGFSVGPCARISYWSWDIANSESDAYFTIGAEAAYKWIFDGGWSIEPIFRISFGLTDVTYLSDYNSFGLGVNLGYSF